MKVYLLIVSCFFSFFVFGCSKNSVQTKAAEFSQSENPELAKETEPIEESVVEEPVPEKTESFIQGTVLKENTGLYLLGRDSKMHSIISIAEGKTIDAVYLDDIIDAYTEDADGQGKFCHVVYDSIDYWIPETQFALNSMPALTIKKCRLYSDPELQNEFTEKPYLSFGTQIALEKSEAENGAVKVFYYDKTLATMKEAYAYKENISTLEDDIAVMKVVDSLKVTTRARPRNDLFAKAAKYNPGKEVKAALEGQKVEIVSNNYEEVIKALPKSRYGVSVPELMTVDQSKDPFQ